MAQFASVAEFADWIGVELEDDDPQAILYLEAASAAVQAYTGQQIELVTDDEVVLSGSWASIFELPQRPVVSVDSVLINGVASAFTLLSGGRLTMGNSPGQWWGDDPDGSAWGGPGIDVTTTYTHGYDADEIPDAIRFATLMIAARIRERPGSPGGAVESETMGNYSYTLGTRIAAEGLVDAERDLLRPWRQTAVSVRT